jgi:O-antigen ligase
MNPVASGVNLVAPAAWCAALFAAATLFSHTVALRLLLLFGGIGLLVIEALRIRLKRVDSAIEFRPPLLIPLALWGAWAALSHLWTLDAAITHKEFRNEIGYAFGAFWLCFVAAQSPRAPRIFAGVLAAGALAVCAVALADPIVAGMRHADQLFLHGGPGAFSSTLLILFPCTLAVAWFARARRWHPAWMVLPLLAVPLYAAAGYGTQNRILWLGLAAEVAIAAIVLLARPALARREKAVIGILAAAAIAGAVTLTFKVHGERFGSGAMAEDPRPGIWQIVLRRIEARPLTGTGFGRGILRHELREEGRNAHLWHSHNLFLDAALQLGWPGLALLLVLFGWTAGLAWRLARSASDTAFACGLALLPLIAGTMMRNLTDVLWVRQSALLYWAAVGILLAWGLKGAGGSSTPLDPPAPPAQS